jgi:hypothetical protein
VELIGRGAKFLDWYWTFGGHAMALLYPDPGKLDS